MRDLADFSRFGRLAATIIALGLTACAGCRSLELPPETDDCPKTVGYTEMRFVDAARGGRLVDCCIWYPADPTRRMVADGDGKNRKKSPRRRLSPDPGEFAEKTPFEETVSEGFFFRHYAGVEWSAPEVEMPPARYELYDLGIGEVAVDSGRALRDLAPRPAAKCPIVVFSHGWMGSPFEIMEVAESLAAAGFVVVAPVHAGNTYEDEFIDRGGCCVSAEEDRPADIKFVIDRVVDLATLPSSPFALKLDLDRIGVLGHSFGAFTVVAASTELAGPRDQRIKALMGVVPYFESVPDSTLASIDVPVLLLGADRDDVAPIDKNLNRAYSQIGERSPFVAALIVRDAGHYHFGSVDRFGQATNAFGIPEFLWGAFGAERLQEGYAKVTDERLVDASDVRAIESRCAVEFFRSMMTGADHGSVPELFDPSSSETSMRFAFGFSDDDRETKHLPKVERRIRHHLDRPK